MSAAGLGRLTADHLGREVVERPDDTPGSREHAVGEPAGEPEVGQRRAVGAEHHVGRLDVAMDEPGLVQRVEPGAELGGDPDELGEGERTVALEPVGERLALDEARGEVVQPVRLARVDDLDEVRVVELRGDASLALEAAAKGLVAGELAAEDLERGDSAGEPIRPEDDPHAALAERRDEAVRPEPVARVELERRRSPHEPRIETRRNNLLQPTCRMAVVPRIGTEFAGYRIEALLGRGGMSVVYRAENARLGNKVALKLLAEELAHDESFRERFVRESRTAATLNHPNIVTDLRRRATRTASSSSRCATSRATSRQLPPREGPLSLAKTLSVVGAGRKRARRRARPRPSSPRREAGEHPARRCFRARRRRRIAYLADFGLTKHLESRSGITASGQFVGTIDYMSPEQIEGREVDGRTDIYSLGCVAFECLAGLDALPARDRGRRALGAHARRAAAADRGAVRSCRTRSTSSLRRRWRSRRRTGTQTCARPREPISAHALEGDAVATSRRSSRAAS